MTQTRTKRHREDPTKSQGIHYTPEVLADYLARCALDAATGEVAVALDPACGGGELLEALVRNASGGRVPSLVGFDTDPVAVAAASSRIEALVGPGGFKIERADFMEQTKGHRETDLFSTGQPGISGVDLVIANPPYVRTQTLGSELATSLARRYGLTGRVDLFTAFAFAMSDVLRPGGVFALLCSNRFLTTRSGEPLRRLLTDELSLVSVTDFGDSKLFEAAVLPVVVIARKGREATRLVPFVSTYRCEIAQETTKSECSSVVEAVENGMEGVVSVGSEAFLVRRGTVPYGPAVDTPWTIGSSAVSDVLARVERSTSRTIKDLAKIRVGIKTTADQVFIRDDWEELPDAMRPEAALLRPLLTHHVVERWQAGAPEKRVLYTHVDRAGKAVPINLADYPGAAAYLESHRERLEGRKYVTDAGRAWFEIWVPQKPGLWSQPKVVFPDIAESPRFCLDTTGAIVNGDCYWAHCPNDETALLLTAVGNSRFARWYYDAQCGNQLYAGRRRFMTQYVERFPVPEPSSPSAQKIVAITRGLVAGHGDVAVAEAEIEGLIAESLGIEEPLW